MVGACIPGHSLHIAVRETQHYITRTKKKRRGTTGLLVAGGSPKALFAGMWQTVRNVSFEKVHRRTYRMYFCMTSSRGRRPSLRKMDGFHMAARATITEEAAVACRKSSMSKYFWMWSWDPPLKGNRGVRSVPILMPAFS